MKKIFFPISLAAVLWFMMFSPWTAKYFNFWYAMTVSASLLTVMALYIDRKNLKPIYEIKTSYLVIGVVSALLLYIVFFVGDFVSKQLFNFASSQVNNIYSNKQQASPLTIGLLLFFLIGPAEEMFWRGFIQRNLENKFGGIKSMIYASLIYAFVHIWAFNFMLFMAALICGFFWGYIYYRYKSVIPGIISHSLWDIIIFLIIPIQ